MLNINDVQSMLASGKGLWVPKLFFLQDSPTSFSVAGLWMLGVSGLQDCGC